MTNQTTHPKISWPRKLLYSGVIMMALLSVVEFASYRALIHKYGGGSSEESQRIHRYDPDLGWMNIPNLNLPSRFGPGSHLTHNSSSFRATEEYSHEIPAGVCRIICLGDSFTHGVCDDRETYAAQMQARCSAVQAINMGTGGFGVDQAYLWYKRDGIQLDANVLVFAFIEDDFNRMQLPTFLARNPKPVILLDDKGSLSVHNVPVPTWGSHTKPWLVEFPRCTSTYIVTHRLISEWCYRHDTLAVACEAFDDLHRLSQERNQELLLVYLPTQDTDLAKTSATPGRIATYAREAGIPFLDLTPQFKSIPHTEVASYFQPKNSHYNAKGNRIVADAILMELKRLRPDLVSCTLTESEGVDLANNQ